MPSSSLIITCTAFYLFWLYGCGANPNVGLQNGQPKPLLFISDGPTYDFGLEDVGSTAVHTFTVTNVGNAPASSLGGGFAVSAFSYEDGSFPGTGGSCATSLAAQASCTIVVTFAPTYTGSFSDSVRVLYNDPSGGHAVTASPILEGKCGIVGP